ncbi:hypothetical protein C7M84_010349 [Penaeus vannamei]|uniref:Protein quiver n=1 Tax=Penaeus vannamei TaxID=6689 RepID=A0A3R7M2T2_PENVA|nr:hypothetical protein C7M84_010349 [Penaeus vannamei]
MATRAGKVWQWILAIVSARHFLRAVRGRLHPRRPRPPCIANPPPPQPCNGSMSVCMTVRTYIPAEEDTRQLVSVVRTCAPADMGWDCKKGRTSRGHVPEVCHDTCYWDGCNHAHSLTPTMLLLPLVSTLVWLGFRL